MFDSTADEQPCSKRKEESSSPFSSLPDALVISCLALCSRSDHASLSLVSNRFRSLVLSPDLYKSRSLLGCTDNYLYVCLRTPPPGPVSGRWFICSKTSNRLRQITTFPSQPLESSVVALEWGIYVIGGKLNGKPSSSVFLLDCRSHKWHEVPCMHVARASAVVGVVDGKIYVYGGCCVETDSWGEVFDPKTQTWDSLLMPDLTHRMIRGSVVLEKKFLVVAEDNKRLCYLPSEGKWGKGDKDSNLQDTKCCVIDELIYYCDIFGNLFWCEAEKLKWEEPKRLTWRTVKGLEALQRHDLKIVQFDADVEEFPYVYENGVRRLSSFGKNIVVFWDVFVVDLDESLEIWCTEISLERRHEGEIWGNIEWSDAIMKTDPLYSTAVLHSVTVNV